MFRGPTVIICLNCSIGFVVCRHDTTWLSYKCAVCLLTRKASQPILSVTLWRSPLAVTFLENPFNKPILLDFKHPSYIPFFHFILFDFQTRKTVLLVVDNCRFIYFNRDGNSQVSPLEQNVSLFLRYWFWTIGSAFWWHYMAVPPTLCSYNNTK